MFKGQLVQSPEVLVNFDLGESTIRAGVDKSKKRKESKARNNTQQRVLNLFKIAQEYAGILFQKRH